MPASVTAIKKSWWALAFGAALLLSACGGSVGGGSISGDHLSAPLPAELSKVTLTTDNLIVKVTLEDKVTKTSKTYTLELTAVDDAAGTFAGRLPGIPPGDYTMSLTFIVKDPTFGDVTVATSGSGDVTVEDGKETAVDTSGYATTYLNDDGDAFTNLDELDAGSDPAVANPGVALFINASYVEYTDGDASAAASNLEASLKTANLFVRTFDGITAADINTATKDVDVLVIPDLVTASLSADLTAEARDALAGFVARGGTVVMFVSTHGNNVALATGAFGLALGTAPGKPTTLNPTAALGTKFAGGPASLPVNGNTTLIAAGSLPTGLEPVYDDGAGDAAVANVPFGMGRVIVLGWNWTDAAPTGAQDGGWLDVLLRAANQFQFRPMAALFANTTYVDYDAALADSNSEASNEEAGIKDMGVPVSTFTDVSATEIAKAVTGKDVLVMPEMENGDVTPDLDSAAQDAIRAFVAAGGTLVANYPSSGLNFLNTVFGFSLAGGSSVTANLDAGQANGTPFQGGPASLPSNNGTSSITQASLPPGSRAVYHDGSGNTTVAVLSFGTGRIVVLGWDWFNATPIGTQDSGWSLVLNAALRFVPAKVALLADDGFVDYIAGNSGSEASNVEAGFTRLFGMPVAPFQGVTAADIAGAVAGRDMLVVPEQERADLSTGMDAAAQTALSDFVTAGGTAVFFFPSSGGLGIINSTFGFALVSAGSTPWDITATATGTLFEGGPASLIYNSATTSVTAASLPVGAEVYYANAASDSAVTIIPFGTGKVVIMGWDWFSAAPVGSTDNGWLHVLKAAVFTGLP